MGSWADEEAVSQNWAMPPEWVRERLAGIPGPMCGKIDAAVSGRRSLSDRQYPTARLPRKTPDEPDADDYADLLSEAERAIEERDIATEALEECRTALDALRGRLIETTHELAALVADAGGAS